MSIMFSAVDVKELHDCHGCPPEIFSLTSLKRLNLSFQGLVHLTPKIQMLENLEELILSHNPLLESLPGAVSKLQHLKGLYSSCYQVLFPSYNVSKVCTLVATGFSFQVTTSQRFVL